MLSSILKKTILIREETKDLWNVVLPVKGGFLLWTRHSEPCWAVACFLHDSLMKGNKLSSSVILIQNVRNTAAGSKHNLLHQQGQAPLMFKFFPTFWKHLFYIQKEMICLKMGLAFPPPTPCTLAFDYFSSRHQTSTKFTLTLVNILGSLWQSFKRNYCHLSVE